jgi:sulfide:quinone oxidoreductase
VVPGGVTWPLPLYEIALLAHAHLRSDGASVRLDVVTPEAAPLDLFGAAASDRVRSALAERDIGLHRPEQLRRLHADAAVALPRLDGPALPGVASTPDGFIRVDANGLVDGTANVYAAGDATFHPVKQGGLATQQAEAVATQIAARAGAPVQPRAFAPALRAVMLTGGLPLYLEGDRDASDAAARAPLAKVVGTRLARWLGAEDPAAEPRGVHLALALADAEAARGDAGAALEWLSAAEAVGGELPPAYAEKRTAWTLGPLAYAPRA